MRFELIPRGPFDLAEQAKYFGGFLEFAPDPAAVAMAFQVQGFHESAAVLVRQEPSGLVTGDVYGAGDIAEAAWRQAQAVLSLDADGTGYPEIGVRDPVIGRLQQRYHHLRPVCFHSPYEAAVNFVIGQRSSIAQARATRQAMARELGAKVAAEGASLYAFPSPRRLLEVSVFRGLSAEKIERLHAIATAALEGRLDRDRLRTLPPETALEELKKLRGVGPFSAQGILFRGAGAVDWVTDDEVTPQAVQKAYELDSLPDRAKVMELAEAWRPYRMWAVVLLHVWFRREAGGPTRARAPGRRRG